MSKKNALGTTIVTAALAAIGIAASIAPASAYIYRSDFDPIEFLGVAYFDVSPGCFLGEKTLVSNDGDSCTLDVCASGTCSNPTIPDCCTSDAMCGDGLVCTTDICPRPWHWAGPSTRTQIASATGNG